MDRDTVTDMCVDLARCLDTLEQDLVIPQYSGRAPLAHPLFSAPLVLAHHLGVPFYSFYLTKPVLFSAPPPLAHLLGVPKGVR